jgi:hypothetical protein
MTAAQSEIANGWIKTRVSQNSPASEPVRAGVATLASFAGSARHASTVAHIARDAYCAGAPSRGFRTSSNQL